MLAILSMLKILISKQRKRMATQILTMARPRQLKTTRVTIDTGIEILTGGK